MLVEILGLPGAGKSTILRGLVPHLREQGVKTCSAEKLEETASGDRTAPRYLHGHEGRTMLFRALAFRDTHPDLFAHIEGALETVPNQRFLFSFTSALYQAALEHQDIFAAVLLDEGFFHRGVHAHLEADDALFDRYLQLIPKPDLILNLCPPPRMAFRRAIQRRRAKPGTRKKVFAKLGDQTVFRRRHRLMMQGLEVLRGRGVPIFDIDTSLPERDCVAQASPLIAEMAQKKAAALALSTAAE